MKSEKGITLMSLIIYMVVMSLVLSMLALVSDMFFSNTNYLTEDSKYMGQYNKFNMYFIEDVKNNKDITSLTDTQIVFKDATTYTYMANPDNSIYRNKVKICSNITYCKFTQMNEKTNNVIKKIIDVHMIIKGAKLFETNNQYVLRYW